MHRYVAIYVMYVCNTRTLKNYYLENKTYVPMHIYALYVVTVGIIVIDNVGLAIIATYCTYTNHKQ